MTESVLVFQDRHRFRQWLEIHHTQRESVWLELLKGRKGVMTHREALEEALCFGWIDSLVKRLDEEKYRVKFSPRRDRSKWSLRNKQLAENLIREGRMARPGFARIAEAKKSGEWDKKPAEVSPGQVELLAGKLERFPQAAETFSQSSTAVRKLMTRYYFDAKREATRAHRLERIADSLITGKPIM